MDMQTLLYDGTEKLPEIFSKDDVRSMLRAIDSCPEYLPNIWGQWMRARDKALLMTIYLMLLRPKEACCLRMDDFNFKDNTIKIRGENNKTGKDRVIPFPNDLIPYYKDYFSFNRLRFWKGSPYLFPSMENSHISPQHFKWTFREKILKPLGLWKAPEDNGTGNKIPKYRLYTLRHTRATEILNKSKDIFLLANLLGHGKLNSTRIYLHKTKAYIEYMRGMIN